MVNPFERVTVASVSKHLAKFLMFDYVQKFKTYCLSVLFIEQNIFIFDLFIHFF